MPVADVVPQVGVELTPRVRREQRVHPLPLVRQRLFVDRSAGDTTTRGHERFGCLEIRVGYEKRQIDHEIGQPHVGWIGSVRRLASRAEQFE
jgi:hypothetical protein